jgi:hypothetical protein
MRYAAVMFLLLCSTAQAELLRGEVSGIVPTTIPWRASTIQAGMPFRLEFTIDTEADRTLDSDGMVVDLYINGELQSADRPWMRALNGPADAGESGLGLLTEDSLTGSWHASAPDNLFVIAFTIPNQVTLPISNKPLQGLTREAITAVTFGYADADQSVKVPILIGDNLSLVPEPGAWLLGVLALVGLGLCQRKSVTTCRAGNAGQPKRACSRTSAASR